MDALLFLTPSGIVDRTEYLEGRETENPAKAISEVLLALDQAGATVAGIPCNTAHAARIYDLILESLGEREPDQASEYGSRNHRFYESPCHGY